MAECAEEDRHLSQSRVLAFLSTAILASMQQVPTRTLSTPEIEIPREFTGIDAVHELRDGRVVVLDRREELLRTATRTEHFSMLRTLCVKSATLFLTTLLSGAAVAAQSDLRVQD